MTFDLALVGGTVIDPSLGIHARRDVLIQGGRVAALVDRLTTEEAARSVDVSGRLVLPGLIDLHAHLFPGFGQGCAPDECCLQRGTTTAVDAGSTGAGAFEAWRRLVAEPSRTRLFAWLNIATIGLIDSNAGELQHLQLVDPERTAEVAVQHRDLIVGIKARASGYVCAGPFRPAFERVLRAAELAGLPVMIHLGESFETLPEILEQLRPGDVITHILTGRRHGALDDHGRLWPQVREARARGILFDAAHGRMNFGFEAARRVIQQGFLPDFLSTDIARGTAVDPEYSLPQYMTKLMALGVPLEEVVRMATSSPAAFLKREGQIGTLRPGACADVAVLADEAVDVTLHDVEGQTLTAHRRLRPVLTVRAGAMVH
ncbi:MAG: amidohydrolase/deacetylase family metallohydrolase [Chloroflexi bacterium]|nr:amidohydrolase/deacetylase family metallohydrolase [Chloroflexota bacterium]